MSQHKTLKLLGLGVLALGVYKIMNTNEWKFYGLLGGDHEIRSMIHKACIVISPNTAENAKLLLAETVAVESRNGKAKDYSDKYGEGLTQFDKPTFLDVKRYYSDPRHIDLMKKIKTFLGVSVLTAQYDDLRSDPMLSIVMARLLYLRVPEKIPDSKHGRWRYYKTWFNSEKGATTLVKYEDAREYAVFNESNVNV